MVHDENQFIGIVLYWENDSFIYIEHLVILPEKRNMKYGEIVLELLKNKGKSLILEIDPPINSISLHRKGFYERCGFVANTYNHVHSSYHKNVKGHELVVMTYPNVISANEYFFC